MNKMSGPGHFRADGSQNVAPSMMMLEARDRAATDGSASRIVSIAIHEKLPLVNGLPRCEAEIQLTLEQAASFARSLLVISDSADAVEAIQRTHRSVRPLA